MANTIALAEKYLPLLEEVYKYASLTSVLDTANNWLRFVGGNKVEVFETEMSGLGNYSRATGFADGEVTASWVPYTLGQDRGRGFMVDNMDNEETAGMAFGTLAGEFLRTKVVPEIDAYRFAKYATSAGTKVKADLADTTDVPALIETATMTLNEKEVPVEGRILFVSENCYRILKSKITRQFVNESGINTEVEMYNGMRVIHVPQNRFNSAVTLLNTTAGGYAVTAGGFKLNFVIIHPSAIAQVVKHEVPRIFDPATNQKADAWMFQYRVYHDAFDITNHVDGIYVHMANTANA